MKIYLSGGMEYAAGEGRDWRSMMQEWVERELNAEVFNPNTESDRLFATRYAGVDFRSLKAVDLRRYAEIASHLVELDCREIAERSNVVICYWDDSAMRGAGTKGELTIARFFGKPVVMVTHMNQEQIPGWVLGCVTHVVPDFDAAKQLLIAYRNDGKTHAAPTLHVLCENPPSPGMETPKVLKERTDSRQCREAPSVT